MIIQRVENKRNFWNMYDRTTQASIRTNNNAEAYHRRIGSVFQCAHPTLWIFIRKLIDEENAVHANTLQIKLGNHRNKTKIYVLNNV